MRIGVIFAMGVSFPFQVLVLLARRNQFTPPALYTIEITSPTRINHPGQGNETIIEADKHMLEACSGCDVSIHDAQTLDLYAKMPERLHSVVTKYHTTTAQLATLASEAKPKLLFTYHTIGLRPGISPPKFLSAITATGTCRSTEEILHDEIGSRYSGQFVIGHDLDVY
jgi:hypothetical protein